MGARSPRDGTPSARELRLSSERTPSAPLVDVGALASPSDTSSEKRAHPMGAGARIGGLAAATGPVGKTRSRQRRATDVPADHSRWRLPGQSNTGSIQLAGRTRIKSPVDTLV